MAQWTSEYAILRDLSVAQGRVPVAIERTVGAGDKPPSLNITEETEEEFFKHCSGDANVTAAPDLGLIQKMLDMVRDSNDWTDREDIDKNIVITKLNPQASEFKPNQKNTSTPTNISPIKNVIEKPKKRQRNVALESILQAIADNKESNEVILRKPDDFMNVGTNIKSTDKVLKELKLPNDTLGDNKNTLTTPTATEKVNGWFETQTETPFPKKTTKVTLEASNIVFKKKEKLKKVAKCPKENLKRLEKSPLSSSSNSGEYKPSTLAEEYYKKFVERSKFKESVKDNIWTKAERKMKEIDEKRRREAQALTSPSSGSQASRITLSFEETQSTDTFTERIVAETKISRCLDMVALPQHRHQLTGDCVVCAAVTKKPKKTQYKLCEENIGITNSTDNIDSTSKEAENLYPKENTENADNESTKESTDNLQIGDLINKELAKFVENTDLNRKVSEYVENLDFESYIENEHSNSITTLGVENVFECVPKTELSFEEPGLSDRSF